MSSCAIFFFFKQKTAYEMRISDWSSDVCSSDLTPLAGWGVETQSCSYPYKGIPSVRSRSVYPDIGVSLEMQYIAIVLEQVRLEVCQAVLTKAPHELLSVASF